MPEPTPPLDAAPSSASEQNKAGAARERTPYQPDADARRLLLGATAIGVAGGVALLLVLLLL